MKPLSADTQPAAARSQVDAWRALSVADKLALGQQLHTRSRAMAAARPRAWDPDDSPREHHLRLAALRLPPELMRAAFDWGPDEPGR